MTRTLKSIIS